VSFAISSQNLIICLFRTQCSFVAFPAIVLSRTRTYGEFQHVLSRLLSCFSPRLALSRASGLDVDSPGTESRLFLFAVLLWIIDYIRVRV